MRELQGTRLGTCDRSIEAIQIIPERTGNNSEALVASQARTETMLQDLIALLTRANTKKRS